MTEWSDARLLSELDDVVQNLARLNNQDWAQLRSQDKMLFERIKLELYARLERIKVNEITSQYQ